MAIIKNKAVVKLVVNDAESRKATMKVLVELDGFTSYTLDFEKSTLVVIGDIDPIVLVQRLSKAVSAKLVTYGSEKDEGKPQKNDGGGGNVGQRHSNSPSIDLKKVIRNKAVVKLVVKDVESKKAAKKAIVELDDFISCTLDFEQSTLVVLGDIDPTKLVNKLRMSVKADLVTFGPEMDVGKPQKTDGGGGNVDQQHHSSSSTFDRMMVMVILIIIYYLFWR